MFSLAPAGRDWELLLQRGEFPSFRKPGSQDLQI